MSAIVFYEVVVTVKKKIIIFSFPLVSVPFEEVRPGKGFSGAQCLG